jgi:hypothetical protein
MLNYFEQHLYAGAVLHEASSGHVTRNQFSQSSRCDILVDGGPSGAGLVIERNAFIVGGTGIRLEGTSATPCIIRHNRFYGSLGNGIVTINEGNAEVFQNLLNGLNDGIQFAEGGKGAEFR